MDPFATFQIDRSFSVDLEKLKLRHHELIAALHPDRHTHASAQERRLALGRAIEVNAAWRILRDPIQRAEALLTTASPEPPVGVDTDLLMEMMDAREALKAAQRSSTALMALQASAKQTCVRVLAELETAFSAAEFSAAGSTQCCAQLIAELRYRQRYLDEISDALEILNETSHDAV